MEIDMLHPLSRTLSTFAGRQPWPHRDDVPDLGPGDADTEPDEDDEDDEDEEDDGTRPRADASTFPVVEVRPPDAWDPAGWFVLLFVGAAAAVRVGSGLVRGEGSSATLVGLTTFVLLLTGLGIAELAHSWRSS